MFIPGDPIPSFHAVSNVNPRFCFDVIAGRYVVLSFLGSLRLKLATDLLAAVQRRPDVFDTNSVAFIGVSVDAQDPTRSRSELADLTRGLVLFWDTDLKVSQMFGATGAATSNKPAEVQYAPRTYVLDQAMRVVAVLAHTGDSDAHLADVMRILAPLPKLDSMTTPAPVIIVPNVFEPELCRTLIDYYSTRGGQDSGFMRDVNGKTTATYDYSHKRRADCEIIDDHLIKTTQGRLKRRVIPAIKQAFQFNVTRIERHIVACYDAATGGHFRAHRDNTTLGTAHRRFAVTINLNADEFEGGELWFPEFSRQRYKAPTGGAVVFSCSLLHEATPVTNGTRYAFLPFLYDEEAAKLRENNQRFVSNASMEAAATAK